MRPGYVYLLYSERSGLHKIGLSKDPERRVKQVEGEFRGMEWKIVATIPTADMYGLEAAFHEAFADSRSGKLEWFDLKPAQKALFVAVADTVGSRREPTPQEVAIGVEEALGVGWAAVMGELKRRQQALTAAVYGEARLSVFDGRELTVTFPNDQSFYVEMARDVKYRDALLDALEAKIGRRPALRVEAEPVDPSAIVEDEEAAFRLAREWENVTE